MSCNHECTNCASKGGCDKQDFKVAANAKSQVKRVVAVMSGKGGVGKSLVTELLAVGAAKRGLKVAVLDADITGPSIPTAFGVRERASADAENNILPSKSACGISLMSLNLLIDNPQDPVVWRGPVIAGTVKQFWEDVIWNDVDYMFVDMPPGTGDVPLTIFQSLPVDGIIVVTSPQELVGMIVEKAVKMAGMMDIPVLAIVENMSSFKCPDCGKVHRLFGDSHVEEIAKKYGISVTANIPIDPEIAEKCDKGEIESCEAEWLSPVADMLAKKLK